MGDQWDKLGDAAERKGFAAPILPGEESGEPPRAEELPQVELMGVGRNLGAFADELGQLLVNKGLFLGPAEQVVEIDTKDCAMRTMTAQRFRGWVEQHVWVFKWVAGRSKEAEPEQKEVSMVHDAAKGVLESPQFKARLRKLDRILDVRSPVFRESGALEMLPVGYDAETRTFTVDTVPIEDRLSFDDARLRLCEDFELFLWGEDDEPDLWRKRSFAVQMAAMLSLWGRMLLPEGSLKPGFLWAANEVSTGKSKLASIVISLLGRVASTGMEREDKMQEKVNAAVMCGQEVLFLDNVKTRVDSPTIDRVITSPWLDGRVLGSNDKWFSCVNRLWVCITANSASVSKDLGSRVLQVNLFSRAGNPDEHSQRIPEERELSARRVGAAEFRGRIISALWSIMRHWDEAGRPGGGRRIRDFSEWTKTFAGMVMAAGCLDPVTPPRADEAASTEAGDLQCLMQGIVSYLADHYPNQSDWRDKEFSMDELVAICREDGLFVDRLGASDDEADGLARRWRSWFGKLLSSKGGTEWIVTQSVAGGADVQRTLVFSHRGQKHRRYAVKLF